MQHSVVPIRSRTPAAARCGLSVLLAILFCLTGGCGDSAAEPTCGDGTCAPGESCATCPDDCGPCSYECGDGLCTDDESCTDCPGDCGDCRSPNYAEEVTIPACSPDDPEVQLITSDADWDTINDPQKTIFCVAPGDYSGAGVIQLTADGTALQKRYVILDDGRTTHPAKLPTDEQADVQMAFDDAHHWVVHRLSSHGRAQYPFRFFASTHNILNRVFVTGFDRGIRLHEGSHDNTIQNSRIGDQSAAGLAQDRVCISLIGEPPVADTLVEVRNTKIVNNEIFNCNDGFQAVRHNDRPVEFAGTIIDGNQIYIEPFLQTDCAGNQQDDGPCACAENALDLKGGSYDPSNPFIVSNNIFWGWRPNDSACGGSNANGAAIVLHMDTRNVVIRDNVFFDASHGVAGSAPSTLDPYGMTDIEISGNLLYRIGTTSDEYQDGVALVTLRARRVTVRHNQVVDAKFSWVHLSVDELPTVDSQYYCNDIVNVTSGHAVTGDNEIRDNTFYDANDLWNSPGNLSFPSVADANLRDFTFTRDRYTIAPTLVTLPEAVVTNVAQPTCAP